MTLTVDAPGALNGTRLRDELAAAGLPVDETDPAHDPDESTLTFNTLDEANRTTVEDVLAGHTGDPMWGPTGRNLEVLDPRDFGAAFDGVTDDTEAIRRAVAYNTGTMRGGILLLPGIAAISDVIDLTGRPLWVYGYGWGDTDGQYVSGLRWIGGAGGTMLRVRASWGGKLERFMLLGHPTAKPVGLSLYNGSGDGIANSYHRIEQVMFGAWPWGDDNEALAAGIRVEGDNTNNDKNLTAGCLFLSCDVGYEQTQPQQVMNRVQHAHFVGCGTAIKTASTLDAQQVMFAHNAVDMHVHSGASLRVSQFGSELSGLPVKVEQSSNVDLRHGYIQASDQLTVGTVLDWVGNNVGSVVMDSVAVNLRPGWDGTPMLRIKASPGGAADKVLRLRDVAGLTEANLDVAIQSPSDRRVVEFDAPKAGIHFRNVLDGSGTLDTATWDNAA